MSKAVQIQRPLFPPGLTWDQLPDSVREQSLDVLILLYLEIVEAPRTVGPPTQELSTEVTEVQSQRCSEHGV
jgi:hypothetical protein